MQFLDGCELILLGKEKLSRINGDPILKNNVVQTLAWLSFWFSVGVVDPSLGQVQWQGMQQMHALTMYMLCTDPEFFFPRVWGARGIFLSANPLQIRACVYIMIYNNTVYHMHVPFFNILNKSYTCLEKGITTIHLCVQMTIAYQYDN